MLIKRIVSVAAMLLLLVTEIFATGARMLIIVPDEFYDEILPLAEWRTKTGISTYVARLSETGATPEQIRAFIQSAYNNWEPSPEYVLIGAAPWIIPFGHRYGVNTDVYYADVTGDFHADLIVGRLPAGDESEMELLVYKILHYERWPYLEDSAWFVKGVTGIAEDGDDDDTIYWNDARFAHYYWNQNGFVEIDSMSRYRGTNQDEFRDAMSEGRSVFLYRGQAVCGWHHPFNINAENLTNYYKFPVIISATCRTVSGSQSNNCEDRKWLFAGDTTAPKGAIAFLGMTTVRVNAAIFRSRIARGFIKAVYGDGKRFGEAVEDARRYLYDELHDMTDYHGATALGDPALRIWTSRPRYINVEYPQAISIGPETLSVRVTIEGSDSPVENALVCIMSDDMRVYTYGETDSTGTVQLSFNTTEPETLSLTVTGQNLIPYEGTIEVIPSGVYLYLNSFEVEEVAGNSDGYPNPGETTGVSITVQNLGSDMAYDVQIVLRTNDPAVQIIDSIESVENIGPHGSVVLNNAFEFVVSPSVHKSRQIDFEIYMTDSSSDVWLYQAYTEIYTPNFRLLDVEIMDTQNGDGRLSPNEHGWIGFTLVNESPTGLRQLNFEVEPTDTFMIVDPGLIILDTVAPYDTISTTPPASFHMSPYAIAGDTTVVAIWFEGDGGTYTYTDTLFIPLPIGASTDPMFDRSYGYWVYDDTDTASMRAPVFDWFEIAPPAGPGTIIDEITNEDADTVTLPLPFDFKFYGITYDSIGICSNGFMEFYHSTYRFGDNSSIPSFGGPMRLVAPFWDDLDPSLRGDIYSYYDEENHRFIVEFKDVAHYGEANTRETFQVQFLDPVYYPTPTGDGQVLFLYQTVADPTSCTVGIEDHTQTRGVQYVFNNQYDITSSPLESGRAILFTTAQPIYCSPPHLELEEVILSDTIGGNGNGLLEPAETASVVVKLHNTGQYLGCVYLSLSSDDSDVVIIASLSVVGNVWPNNSVTNEDYPFTISLVEHPSDSIMNFELTMFSDEPQYIEHVEFTLPNSLTPGVSEDDLRPEQLRFGDFTPNPSRSFFMLKFQLPKDGEVRVEIYDVTGRLVALPLSAKLNAGIHSLLWDGRGRNGQRLPAGLYYACIKFDGKPIKFQKLVMLK